MPFGHELLKHEVESENIFIDPYNPDNVRECSIDLTLGSEIRQVIPNATDEHGEPYIDTKKPGEDVVIKPNSDGTYYLYPGEFYLGHSVEKAGSNIYQPSIETRSSVARLTLMAHTSAGWGEPGFCGQWTLEIVVLGPYKVKVYPGSSFCQVAFNYVDGPVKRYEGKYKNQTGARASKGVF